MATSQSALATARKSGDLQKRLMFLLMALIVYRLGTHIPVPGIDPDQLASLFQGQQGGILGMFNMFSGGALSRFSVFALGIMPYISASIIMQLLTVVVPQLEALTDGHLADVVVEAAGEPGSINLAIDLVKRYGNLFYFGIPRQHPATAIGTEQKVRLLQKLQLIRQLLLSGLR